MMLAYLNYRLNFLLIEPHLINRNPDQPRKHFNPESLAELSQSIKEKGVLQPIIIRVDEKEKYHKEWKEKPLKDKVSPGYFFEALSKYTDDDTMEAGRFLKENLELFPEHAELEDFTGLANAKQYRIFELPTDVLQAKTVHKILEREDIAAVQDCTDTAVILCDEELLMPVIMSLPESLVEINITMGYPMKNSPVYSLIDSLLRMQNNLRHTKAGRVTFYHKDVVSILLHPYMRNPGAKSGDSLLEEMTRNNLIMVVCGKFVDLIDCVFKCCFLTHFTNSFLG